MWVDSAVIEDLERANELGYVTGVTTNPLLLARARAGEPLQHLRLILEASAAGTVLYQPCASEPAACEAEARRAYDAAPARVGIKLLATAAFTRVAHTLIGDGIPCALTGVYAPAQALIAHDLGCRWVIPYVDRAQRLCGDDHLVRRLRDVLGERAQRPLILAASIKSVDQAVQAYSDGADMVSAPLDVVRDMIHHDLTVSAARDFEEAAATLGQRSAP